MGEKPSKFDEPLMPQPVPIWASEPRFCVPHEVTLHLSEQIFSFTGDDFKIKDPNTGVVWFKCLGKVFSLREKKTLCDNTGVPVLNIKETLLSFGTPDYKVYRGDSSEQELFRLNARLTFLKAKASASIINAQNGQHIPIVVKGDFRTKAVGIYMGEPKQGGILIAKLHRPHTGRAILFAAQDYYATIAANVDVALIVALCICVDEMKKDSQQRGNL